MSKICPGCGAVLKDDQAFCTSCGTNVQNVAPQQNQFNQNMGYQQNPYQQNGGYQQNPYTPYQQNSFETPESHWDGGVLESFCAFLVTSILITCTCGIATPWAICYLWKFIVSHTVVDGYRLTFDGTGAQLFGNWIKWFVLIMITCGIYGFWVYPRLFNWVAKHTHFYS